MLQRGAVAGIGVSLTRADRAWIRRQLAKQREEIRADTWRTLHEVLSDSAALRVLQDMTQSHQTPPSA